VKKIISMILVGGRGTRLGDITKNTAKPAVSFGAKYRLIDFTLSNISNSDIDVCGIVTQYEPFELMNYIGSGASWDLDYIDGGIRFLTPYSQAEDVLWQKGTAHAIKQYFRFIKDYQPEHILILSGDHIYKMDYNLMLKHHIEAKAELTISATTVGIKEAKRFGTLEVNDQNQLTAFYEKPDKPVSNLASMGIYLFSYEALERIFFEDNQNELVDFGRNIIPYCLKQNYDISVYKFNDYWRDVGTIESLYQANMEMLEDPKFLGLNSSQNLPIFSKSLNLQPHVILDCGAVTLSVIADGSIICGKINHSTISYHVVIEKGSEIEDSVIFPNVKIGKNCILKKVLVDRNTVIPDNYRLVSEKVVLVTQNNLFEVGEIHE